MENVFNKAKCNKCGSQLDEIYEITYHNVYECPNCGYQKALLIDDCCRDPFKIVIIDRTMKTDRLLYQCKNCGGIVNKNKPLSFKIYSDQIRDEINIERFNEWKENHNYDYLAVKDQILEHNYKLSNFGKLNEHYASEEYRTIRKQALIRDNYKCQKCGNEAEEVHHLTYDNFPNEKIEDLQSLCSNCHNKITWKERFERISKKKDNK